jgi:hypothetical protein
VLVHVVQFLGEMKAAQGVNYILRVRFDRLVLLVILVGVAASLGASVARSGSPPSAAAQQSCVDRWNWMHYGGWFVRSAEVRWAPARVRANPCRIEIAYLLAGSGRHTLVPYFPCSVNRFGAYVCAAHAYGPANGLRLSGTNARFFPKRNGWMRLDYPRTHRPVTAKPSWVRRYEVDHGFIVPFDRRGRLRAGLTLTAARPFQCYTLPDDQQWPYLWGCGGTSVCFAPTLPARRGELLACPTQPGSRRFVRAAYRHP